MYAPNPVRRLEVVEVHVTMADGSDRVWTLQRGDLVIGPFTWYRWQKLKEQLVREPADPGRVRAVGGARARPAPEPADVCRDDLAFNGYATAR